MFKKLRNRLLIVNTMIIAALVLGSFSVIFIVTAQNTERGIDRKIEMELSGIIGEHTRDQMPVDMKKIKVTDLKKYRLMILGKNIQKNNRFRSLFP